MSLLEKLKAGIKNSKEAPFHGSALKIRVLSEDELQQCRIDANRYAVKHELDEESLYNEIAVRQLYMAVSDADGNKLAADIDSFRKLITRKEREYLIDEYLHLENECSPSLSVITEDEFNRIAEEAKKDPFFLLSRSNTDLLRRLLRYLENRQ
jgi:hypothetical protein